MGSELIPAVLFLACVAFVYYLEARFWVRRWLGRETRPRRLLHAIALLGAVCMLYGWLVEPSRIEVRTVRLEAPRLSGKVRVIQVSDLHSEERPFNEPRVAELVNVLDPDVIVVTGDYLNTERGAPTAKSLLTSLRAKQGKFCVNGNYDLVHSAPDLLQGTGFRMLDRDSITLGSGLRILGLDVRSDPAFKRFMTSQGPSPGYDVLLFHYSDLADEAAAAGIDLYLSGHTHGGQVRMPLYGALLTLAAFGKRFESGLYHVGNMALYVNRGLGMEGGSAPRVRFLCRPEITVFDLQGQGG